MHFNRPRSDARGSLNPACPIIHGTCLSFMAFFFAAAWRALRYSFPGKPIKGCVYNWNQAMWLHVQQVVLSTTYKQREGVYDYIRQLIALPFLPARHIPATFDHLKRKTNAEPLQRQVDYVDRQLFNHAVFGVPSLVVFLQTVRTNNDVMGNNLYLVFASNIKYFELSNTNSLVICNAKSKHLEKFKKKINP